MSAPVVRPSRVGSILSDVLKRVDPEQQLRAYGIWAFWNDEVGDAIARRAQPAGFRNGILFVTVATHSWMQELQFMKDGIRDRLNTRLGAELVRDIFFVSGNVDVETDKTKDAVPQSSAHQAALVALPAIADAKLAAIFTRIVDARARHVARTPQIRGKKPRRDPQD